MSLLKRGLLVLFIVFLLLSYVSWEFTSQVTYVELLCHVAIVIYVYQFAFHKIFRSEVDNTMQLSITVAAWPEIMKRMTLFSTSIVIPAYFVHGDFLFKPSENVLHRFPTGFNFPLFWQCALVISAVATWRYYRRLNNPAVWPEFRYVREHPELIPELIQLMGILGLDSLPPNVIRIDEGRLTVMCTKKCFFALTESEKMVTVRLEHVDFQVKAIRLNAISTGERTRFVFIRATFTKDYMEPLEFRLAQEKFEQLNAFLPKPITIPPHIKMPLTPFEELCLDFIAKTACNSIIKAPMKQKEPCFGCGSTKNIVKIVKSCNYFEERRHWDEHGENVPTEHCQMCNCKPIWCSECIAKIFVGKQNTEPRFRNDYDKGTGQCPTCRKRFCIQDVHLVQFVKG